MISDDLHLQVSYITNSVTVNIDTILILTLTLLSLIHIFIGCY